MEFLFLIGGFVLGIIITTIFKRKDVIFGFIDVDQNTGLCRVHISSDELANTKNKKVVFTINHNVDISQE